MIRPPKPSEILRRNPSVTDHPRLYDDLLSTRRWCNGVLEVGSTPVSMDVWAELFPVAAVIGISHDPVNWTYGRRIWTCQIDPRDAAALRLFALDYVGYFSFIRDNLGVGYEVLKRCLTADGVYVIEGEVPQIHYSEN